MTEAEIEFDALEIAIEMVESWTYPVLAAMRKRHGDAVADDLERNLDVLRTTLWDLRGQSRRLVREGEITSVEDVPIETIQTINEIEGEQP